MKIQLKCKACGKEFSTYESRKDSRKYCSRDCYYKGREYKSGEDNPRYKRIIKTCLFCKKEFWLRPCAAKTRKYCSLKCSIKSGKDNPMSKPKVKNVCLICGKEYYKCPSHAKNAKYCSRRCAILGQAQNRKVWNKGKRLGGNLICEICGKEYYASPARLKHNSKYCNWNCFNEAKRRLVGEKAAAWQGGKSFEPYSPEFNNRLKIEIRKRDDNICQRCGRIQINRALSIHHIDYDKMNNKATNLIALCPSCHAKTNHKREYWQSQFEYFRHHRRYDRLTIEK